MTNKSESFCRFFLLSGRVLCVCLFQGLWLDGTECALLNERHCIAVEFWLGGYVLERERLLKIDFDSFLPALSEWSGGKMQELEWESKPRENKYCYKTRDFIVGGIIEGFQKPCKVIEYTKESERFGLLRKRKCESYSKSYTTKSWFTMACVCCFKSGGIDESDRGSYFE